MNLSNKLILSMVYVVPMYIYTVILLMDYTHLKSSAESIMYISAIIVVLTLATFIMLYGRLPETTKAMLPMYIFFASIILFVVRRSLPILLDSGTEMFALTLSVLLLTPFMAVSQSRIYGQPTKQALGGELESLAGGKLLGEQFPLKGVFTGKIKYVYGISILFWGIFLSHSFPLLFLVMFFIMVMSMSSVIFNKSKPNPFAMGVSAILLVQGFIVGSIIWLILAMVNGTPAPFTVPIFDVVLLVQELISFLIHAFIVSIHVSIIGLVYVLKRRDLPARVYNSFAFVGVTVLSFVATFMFTRGEVPLFLHLVLLYTYMLSFFAIGRVALDFDTLVTKRPLLIVITLVCIGLGSGMVGLIPWEWYRV